MTATPGGDDGAGAGKSILTQSFLTSLPIVLTVGLGFVANYVQSRQQHQTEMETLAAQAKVGERARTDEAARAYNLQRSEAAAKLQQQAREFDANARMAASRFAQEQLTLRAQHAAQSAQQAREASQSLERQRMQGESALLLEVIKVGDLAVARSNIEFLLQAGLVRDPDGRIARAAVAAPPVLPTASGNMVESVGFEDTGALGPVPAAALARSSAAAARLLGCATAEYDKNVRENGGDQQIKVYLEALGLPPDTQIAWSGAFVGYCLQSTGADAQIKPSAANYRMMERARQSGIWLSATTQPLPGDIYFIARGAVGGTEARPMHIGIVREVNGRAFKGYEGNLGNRISLVSRSLDTARLEGFARLKDR